MTLYNKIFFILFTLLTAPQLLSGWPQRNTRQPAPMSSSCNVTFVAESRSGRPSFPDPKINGDDDAVNERTVDYSRVIFPGLSKSPPSELNFPGLSDRTGTEEVFVPQVPNMDRAPSCAEGSTFCVDSDNYPRNHVATLIEKQGNVYRDFFGEDVKKSAVKKRLSDSSSVTPTVIDATSWERMPIQANITQRLDTSPDETPLCLSLEQVVYPKMALNKDDKWLFIVNQENQFVQGVRVEKCIKEGPCALTDSLPIGYKTSCRQKYIYRKLLSLNSEGKAISDSFRIPSCCACYFRMSGVASRFGAPQTTLIGRTRGGAAAGGQSSVVQPSTQLSRPQIPDTPRSMVSVSSSTQISTTNRGTKFRNDSRNRN